MKVLVTGSAGFIGFHVARRLLAAGHAVAGIDAMVPYYDVRLKEARHARLAEQPGFTPHLFDLVEADRLAAVMAAEAPEVVIHLAAQAGVRYALEHPESYIHNNVQATYTLLEAVKARPVRHLLMASTSSAYGANTAMPFKETDAVATPLNIYAATKLATEQIGHSYAALWQQPITMFRFFTVYGPWGRPDMAFFKFTDAILKGRTIDVYNHGRMERDFTYVDDLVESILRLVECRPEVGRKVAECDSISAIAPFRIVNIGNAQPVQLLDFIAAIERACGREAIRNYMDMQPGEVLKTWADASLLRALTGYGPSTDVATGVAEFVAWYRGHYGI
ncbi:NAD-dependent epimerase/dehydratase family protein [Paracraurococcus ruber]|uniref:UDP-glucuronate 5-epimerase n=1 Tax=Paracraurococcus ruber TaxID=77675 RepID=A0ABS1CYR0_9PROT|nr:NAD-dependent epimerase/dehydratase family protein [Paracraurococcus ruber]MBK1659560.1 UDP-glucuronate 5-epimerase [Paracraurococcus ruber]TDG33096.1 NAD-dependent epimerase/dehydratase family protein [Paracraurococcus ruber]